MKFEEKLIKLRKSRHLSQEELGEHLNVTRQTISKWELGLSKPDMDKLIEISNFFNVSVDFLTNDNLNSEQNTNNYANNINTNSYPKAKKMNNKTIIILIIIGIVIIVSILGIIVVFTKSTFVSPFERIFNSILSEFDKSSERYDQIENMITTTMHEQMKNPNNDLNGISEESHNTKEEFNKVQQEMINEFEENKQIYNENKNTIIEQYNEYKDEIIEQYNEHKNEIMEQNKNTTIEKYNDIKKLQQDLLNKYNK